MSPRPRPASTAPPFGRATIPAVVVALAVGVAVVLLAAPAPGATHHALVSVSPASGSTVAVAPETVVLTFDQPAIALGTQVEIRSPDGTTASAGEATLAHLTVQQGLVGPRPAGTYTVTWRVTSLDGHPLTGTFEFTALG